LRAGADPSRSEPRAARLAGSDRQVSGRLVDEEFLEQFGATYRFSLGQPKSIRFDASERRVLFLRAMGPRNFVHNLYEYDLKTGKERTLLTAEQILNGAAEQISADERARRERQRLSSRGIVSYSLSLDGRRILVPLSGRLFLIERATGEVRELVGNAGYPLDPRFSPDGTRIAYVRNGDIHLTDLATGRERALTRRSGPQQTNGLAEFVAQEEMGRHHGYAWSPDGKHLVYQQTNTKAVETLYVANPALPARPPLQVAYPRAGRNNAEVALGILDLRRSKTTWIQWDRERFPYVVSLKWPRSAPLTVVVQDRRQHEVRVLVVRHQPSDKHDWRRFFPEDVAAGVTRTVLLEKDDAWINIDAQMPHWIDNGQAFLWTSERSGWAELYRVTPGPEQPSLTQLTPTVLGYQRFLHYDGRRRHLYLVAASTASEGHLYAIDLAKHPGSRRLSPSVGMHQATFSRKGGVYLLQREPLSGSPSFAIYDHTGRPRGELASVAEKPPFEPRVELESVRVGGYQLAAAIVRPRSFRPNRRYPVLLYIYGGPGHRVVRAYGRYYLLQQWLSDQGFVVVALDGRGTPYRGRSFERAIKGNFVELPLADQVAGLYALGARHPELDLGRAGIYGWSFGGYLSAMAVLKRPDVFRAAVAGAPVTDWLDYDTHYTERYLGLPSENRAGYRASSAVALAGRLSRPLLLIHGTVDDNVYFSHAIKLSDALFRAGKPHEFLPLSGLTHMVPDPLVTRRLYGRIARFFINQLRR
jgi:dipeptidyl-peptidase-4